MKIRLKINGRDFAPHIYPNMILLDLLRDLGFKSVKQGCGTTNCGLCTVIMDGGQLDVSWDPGTKEIRMTGTATTVFEGTIELEED